MGGREERERCARRTAVELLAWLTLNCGPGGGTARVTKAGIGIGKRAGTGDTSQMNSAGVLAY